MDIVLAIDDDITALELLEHQLVKRKFRVFTETSPTKGIEMAKSLNPNVILLDLNMPVVNGFEVMKKLQKDEITRDIPVIMLTAVHDKQVVIQAMSHGIVDYVVKPYDVDSLSKKLQSAIQYGNIKRKSNITDKSDSITVYMEDDLILISFKSNPHEKRFLDEAKTIFTKHFFQRLKNRHAVIDLRTLDEFSETDITVLETIVKLFGQYNVYIVTGRHYGDIISQSDLDEESDLFVSLGDLKLFLAKENASAK
ncbi:MAG: response regulator [bacterium]|nr:response regulator [bacterium]